MQLPDVRSSSFSLSSVPPCIDSKAMTIWLNRGDVRKALHIPDTLPPWDICRFFTNTFKISNFKEINSSCYITNSIN